MKLRSSNFRPKWHPINCPDKASLTRYSWRLPPEYRHGAGEARRLDLASSMPMVRYRPKTTFIRKLYHVFQTRKLRVGPDHVLRLMTRLPDYSPVKWAYVHMIQRRYTCSIRCVTSSACLDCPKFIGCLLVDESISRPSSIALGQNGGSFRSSRGTHNQLYIR
jgi:hypothetical protein